MSPLKNIVLIGFMASGKSLLARALAGKLNRPVISTDALIEHKEQCSVRQIFEDKGEAYFRQLEHDVIREIAQTQGAIIDCGGGVILNPKNFELLRKNGIIVHLKTTPEVIYARIKGEGSRPLLNVPNPLGTIRELYEQRLPLYNQADVMVDTSDPSLEAAVIEILAKVKG